MKLLIVESPAKAKTINKYLGKDFKVLASYGHIRDLPSKDGSVNPDEDFAMNYKVSTGSEKHIKDIVSAAKDSDTIYLATDMDREGEAISWHVLEELKRRRVKLSEKTVHRVAFNQITKAAITEAVANPRELDMSMVNAQQARRALDYLVGFNLSPVLWRKVRPGLSAGRVQSVALRLICEREAEIEAFNAEEYWSITADFLTEQKKKVTSKLVTLNGEKLEKFSITNEKDAQAALKALQAGSYSVSDIQKKKTRRSPGAPFMTSTIQMEASRKLGFGARRTMGAAQKLYEAGLITYMRTDSVALAPDAIQGLRAQIGKQYGDKYVPSSPNLYKNKSQNAQEAHEAIRPTNPGITPDTLQIPEEDSKKLYSLIWKRTMASQMEKAVLDQTRVMITTDDKQHVFAANGSIVAFDGFMKVYIEGRDDDKASDGDEKLLPAIEDGETMETSQIEPHQHFTEPPPRFSEATLVKGLEERSIGRPSTYASIIGVIQDRGYVKQEKRRFMPEDVGKVVNKFLTMHFDTYVDYDFTANLENTLDEISRGEKDWIPVMTEFWQPFKDRVDDKIESVKKSDVTTEGTGETCPECKEGEMVYRLGRYGKFKGCNRYPECKYIEKTASDTPKEEPIDTGIQCPSCKAANIVEKKSRRGKVFYGCGSWPKCNYALWDKPLASPCPQDNCKWPITTEKTLKTGTHIVCPNCEWADPPLPERAKRKPKADKKEAAAKKAAPKKKAATKKAAPKKTAAKKPAAKKPAAKAKKTA
ncbi:MAG: type I DNA topoisomerase [Alphaproteobacteria bacterium]|nr:type I DNA topoisomerase [Alphaproteobacteria bacterium]